VTYINGLIFEDILYAVNKIFDDQIAFSFIVAGGPSGACFTDEH
jgi:hypothetical protein